MIRLPLSQLGKWDRGQKDMKKGRERERWRGKKETSELQRCGGTQGQTDREEDLG